MEGGPNGVTLGPHLWIGLIWIKINFLNFEIIKSRLTIVNFLKGIRPI